MSQSLILLVNLIYLPSIWYGLVADDATRMKTDPFNKTREKIFSLLLHITVSQYLFLAASKLSGNPVLALVAALLFSVHPFCVQVSVWIAGRSYGLNALLFLVIILFAPFSIPLYFLASKGIATLLLTPLCFIFTKYWYIALMCPVMILLSKKLIESNINSKIKGGEGFAPLPKDFELQKFRPENLIIVVKTFGYYALACLLPIKNGYYNSFLSTVGASKKETDYWYSLNRHFWGGLLAIGLMLYFWLAHRTDLIGFGIMLFVTSIIPFLNFITVQQQTAPRYAYLPLIGYQIALISLIFHLPIWACYPIIGALFMFYLDRTIKVMQHYKGGDLNMIILDSQVFPDNPRCWYFRYEHMLHQNNPVMAWAEASYGLKYCPEDCQLWFGLAVATFELGDYTGASKFLDNSERFMMLTDRTEMKGLILEFRDRITQQLAEKWKKGRR